MSITIGEAVYDNAFKDKLQINGTSIGHMLKSYTVQKIKQVTDSKTTIDGTIHFTEISGYAYTLQLTFLPLLEEQFYELATLLNPYTYSVSFYDPGRKGMITSYRMYNGDRTAPVQFYWSNGRKLMGEFSINLIGIANYAN